MEIQKRNLELEAEVALELEAVHGKRFVYDLNGIQNRVSTIPIICPEHGLFQQTIYRHLTSKHGCPKCSRISAVENTSKGFPYFQEKIEGRYPGEFDFSNPEYTKASERFFLTHIPCGTRASYLYEVLIRKDSVSCRVCTPRGTKAISQDDCEKRFRQVHGETYDYDFSTYKNATTKMSMICREHGVFEQTPMSHWNGHGCQKCGVEKMVDENRLPRHVLQERAYSRWGDAFEYDWESFITTNHKMRIFCKKNDHGWFTQSAGDHLAGHGCRKCVSAQSTPETEILEFIASRGLEAIHGYRMQNNKEIDIYLPSLRLGIEYDGLYYHSSAFNKDKNYHLKKTLDAAKEGIRVIHIFEDEWVYSRSKVESILSMNLKIYSGQKIFARNTSVVGVPWSEAKAFLEEFHLQGAGAAATCVGLISQGQVVAVMGFRNTGIPCEVELIRFVSRGQIVGGFSKLLRAYLKDQESKGTALSRVVSFSDTRWSLGDVYEKNGFQVEYEIPPDYMYTRGMRRFHKRGFQHQYLKAKFDKGELPFYDPEETELVNCEKNHYYQIWDCGKKKWVLDL